MYLTSFLLRTVLYGLFLLTATTAQSDPLQVLQNFYRDTLTLSADFEQTVLSAQGQKKQQMSGHLQLQRPNKFRWEYKSPYSQLVVSGGKTVILYDPDLNQVTTQPLNKALNATPAALLAGNTTINRFFQLQPHNRSDTLTWVQADYLDTESAPFKTIWLGFNRDTLQAMEMLDQFDQTTRIRFFNIQQNPKIPESAFTFKPPANADVLKNPED